jgi:long-chain-fatty-acid--[acyl-carrier-protein] ligase
MYNLPFLRPIMRRIRAIPMPDMEFDSGPYKRRRIQHALEDVVERLRRGENILIYPSGRLSVTGEEKLGAASGVHTILRQHPNVAIAMVRIKGLYGSIFSKALTGGTTPDVGATLRRAATIFLKNFLFFAPRRAVTIEIISNPSELPRYSDPLTLNRYLENFYNQPAPEKAVLVPHYFWSKETPLLPERPIENHSLADIAPAVREKVYNHIAHAAQTSVDSLTPETLLGDDLGLDSLTIAEFLIWLDREFEAHDIELSELVSVSSVLRAASGQLGTKTPKAPFIAPSAWRESVTARPPVSPQPCSTIGEAFIFTASRMGKLPAMGDEKSGVLRWDEVKLRVFLLARYIANLKGDHIGLLFPASVAGSLTAMATILAGKVPVFLNWTAGKRALLHACDTTDLHAILTAQSFLDIVPTDLEFLESKCIFLEALAEELTFKDKLAAKRLSREAIPQLTEAFGLKKKSGDDPAVILFTSGSEALPKGVVLTHNNLLANIRGVLDAFPVRNDDMLLGFLPTFHSFGLTVCTVLPLVTGLRVAYHPNPNESRKIAKAIPNWGATIVAGTPTFLRSILQAGAPEQFASLRTLISGAERAPQDLFDRVAALPNSVSVLEGYGITECAPVVSMNRPNESRIGVGKPLLGTTLKIVHPATFEEVPLGTDGLILIHSPSVFPGYLDPKLNPFVDVGGTRFYNSGDIGRIQDGSLVISGRLKRFIKIAGEMVSLTAVEEALQQHLPSHEDAPSVAVLAKGTEGDARPTLTLFTSVDVSAEAANTILHQAGFPHLVSIANVRRLQDLPLLGSGKTDYQELKRLLDGDTSQAVGA